MGFIAVGGLWDMYVRVLPELSRVLLAIWLRPEEDYTQCSQFADAREMPGNRSCLHIYLGPFGDAAQT